MNPFLNLSNSLKTSAEILLAITMNLSIYNEKNKEGLE